MPLNSNEILRLRVHQNNFPVSGSCPVCKSEFQKSLRLGVDRFHPKYSGLVTTWYHPTCFPHHGGKGGVEKFHGYENLSSKRKEEMKNLFSRPSNQNEKEGKQKKQMKKKCYTVKNAEDEEFILEEVRIFLSNFDIVKAWYRSGYSEYSAEEVSKDKDEELMEDFFEKILYEEFKSFTQDKSIDLEQFLEELECFEWKF